MDNWWLNRKQHAYISDTFDSLVTESRKTSPLPNIRDGAINALIGLTQGSMSYASYTQWFTDFLRRSRQPLTDDFECVQLQNSGQSPSFSAKGLHHALGGAT
jgi:hypothetical protein